MPIPKSLALHRAQFIILESLRHQPVMRYSNLRAVAGLESDVFKFHIRALKQSGVIEKLADGSYSLTPAGKEYANNLDRDNRTTLKQPKQSVLLVVHSPVDDTYLLQRRKRQPHYGYWGFLSGPVQWGSNHIDTAAAELFKQTGLAAEFKVRSFYRKITVQKGAANVLEDVLFSILTAEIIADEALSVWNGGENRWLTRTQMSGLQPLFEETIAVIDGLSKRLPFLELFVERSVAEF